MTKEEFQKLERGCIVQHVRSRDNYVIDDCFSPKRDRYVAVKTILITNPDEWVVVKE